ncbi:hypothetical protein ZEAMMB73_Zm00001d017750 [Zea mays]|uniref:Uncharacterized protein n=1 Tax=Zea mays TaxID=4577 RepID=A0A1D6HH83_MAIZE|nr:hypothetical protein ZEAMMB73_Zm00001d017750 [Zea mays]
MKESFSIHGSINQKLVEANVSFIINHLVWMRLSLDSKSPPSVFALPGQSLEVTRILTHAGAELVVPQLIPSLAESHQATVKSPLLWRTLAALISLTIRTTSTSWGDVSLLSKILAALATGVIAIVVANPTDLVKVRLQADGKANTVKRSYSGALNDGLWDVYNDCAMGMCAELRANNDALTREEQCNIFAFLVYAGGGNRGRRSGTGEFGRAFKL